MANLRGGGEYGPAWHRAAIKRNRHRVHEDFAAVARSLVERGVTTPSGLAVHGGSNGGLLVGTMLTRYPELVGAVVCEVPLLDMRRYTHLPAGASWEAEYGDPDDPDQWEWIKESPLSPPTKSSQDNTPGRCPVRILLSWRRMRRRVPPLTWDHE